MLGRLFRETDRVQRMNTALSFILFDIDDFGHWNSRLDTSACDDLLASVAERVGRLLRSYDLLGRVGKDEFLVALPGCSALNAGLLAERMRTEVFAEPFDAGRAKSALVGVFRRGAQPRPLARGGSPRNRRDVARGQGGRAGVDPVRGGMPGVGGQVGLPTAPARTGSTIQTTR